MFDISGGNPQAKALSQGESYQFNWTLNVTSASEESYLIDVLFNSSYGNALVPNNDTEDRQVDLNPSGEPPADETPPYFTNILNQTINEGESLSYDINASDETAFDCFFVNDTDFQINCDGLLTNTTTLSVQLYNLNITINDSSNNLNSSLMWVNVTAAAADTCSYTSGDWNVDCSDNCDIVSPVDLGGNNIFIKGVGVFNVNNKISNLGNLLHVSGGCRVHCSGGNCFTT